jgi:hypothetical protein
MLEAKLLLTVLLMASIQLVAYFGSRAKPQADEPVERA